MNRLHEQYNKKVKPELQKEFGYKNTMQIPKLSKVVVSVGIGRLTKDSKAIDRISADLTKLTGQKPSIRVAKKSIAGFKVRKGMPVGLMVTLRGKRMWDFMDRLISIALPRSRDFRGVDPKHIDSHGNLNLGIKEHSIFPEISYESVKDLFSLQVTVTTTATNQKEGKQLLRLLGFPFKKVKENKNK